MRERSSVGSSIVRSGVRSGKAGQSAGFSVLRRKVDLSQETMRVRSDPSKVTAASGRVFTMLVMTLPEITVSPGSSTFAGMRWRMEMVRLFVWNSSVALLRADVDARKDGERGVGAHPLGHHGEGLHEGGLADGELHVRPFLFVLR